MKRLACLVLGALVLGAAPADAVTVRLAPDDRHLVSCSSGRVETSARPFVGGGEQLRLAAVNWGYTSGDEGQTWSVVSQTRTYRRKRQWAAQLVHRRGELEARNIGSRVLRFRYRCA